MGLWQRGSLDSGILPLFFGPSKFSTTSSPSQFHKPAIASSWWPFKANRRHSAESLPSIEKNQDFDVLQLEQRRCVENTNQMFGLRTQNNMYLTLQFKMLNSNMCLVGFPENIESWSIKSNKYQLQLVVAPSFFLSLPSLRVFSNYFQTPLFSKWELPICLDCMRQWFTLANTISHSGHSLFLLQPSGRLFMRLLCLACFPNALALSKILLVASFLRG